MIGQHPQLAGLPELKLFSYRTIAELELSLPAYWRARGITHRSPGLAHRAFAEFEFGGQTPKRVAAALESGCGRAAETGPAREVLDRALLTRLAPRQAVEKSPENVTSAGGAETARGGLPECALSALDPTPADHPGLRVATPAPDRARAFAGRRADGRHRRMGAGP